MALPSSHFQLAMLLVTVTVGSTDMYCQEPAMLNVLDLKYFSNAQNAPLEALRKALGP